MQADLGVMFPHATELEEFTYTRGCMTDAYYAAAGWGEQPLRYWLDSAEVNRRLGLLNAHYQAAGLGRDGRSHDFDFDRHAPAAAVAPGYRLASSTDSTRRRAATTALRRTVRRPAARRGRPPRRSARGAASRRTATSQPSRSTTSAATPAPPASAPVEAPDRGPAAPPEAYRPGGRPTRNGCTHTATPVRG